MKKIKYIFRAVATMLVTAFYIINIQPKSQDIIADRLPKGVLVANNAEQNPNHIPSNQEVLVALDNYVKTHKLFIVATVVTPEGNAGFHPEYMTFGKGILGNDMILFYSPKLTVQTMNYWVWVQLIIF